MNNYFELFELPNNYDIDIGKLKNKYLELQSKYHPDKAMDKSQKIEFIDKSMQLNNGYKSLIDTYSRAEHLLALHGLIIDSTKNKNLLSMDELEEIWKDNEELESAKTLEDLYAIERKQLAYQKQLIDKLTNAFKVPDIEKALEITIKLKYLTNLVKNVRLKIKDANSRN